MNLWRAATLTVLAEYNIECVAELPFGKGFLLQKNNFEMLLAQAILLKKKEENKNEE